MKGQTYTDAIEHLLSTSVMLPPELLSEIVNFTYANKHLGYTTREELIREAIRFKLGALKGQYEYTLRFQKKTMRNFSKPCTIWTLAS